MHVYNQPAYRLSENDSDSATYFCYKFSIA